MLHYNIDSFVVKSIKFKYEEVKVHMLMHNGVVAQMVERRLGMAEAPGSNPGHSTHFCFIQ